MRRKKILIYGYGNPDRQDDGLGIAFVNKMQGWVEENKFTNIFLESNYQLNIEDSLQLSEMDFAIFVDASKSGPAYNLKKLNPKRYHLTLTHFVSPEVLIYLCKKLYNKTPKVHLLTIRGYNWDIGEEISSKAEANLKKALFQLKISFNSYTCKQPEKIVVF